MNEETPQKKQPYHQLSVGGEQSGAVSLHLAVLFAQTVLHGEPVQLTGKTEAVKVEGSEQRELLTEII